MNGFLGSSEGPSKRGSSSSVPRMCSWGWGNSLVVKSIGYFWTSQSTRHIYMWCPDSHADKKLAQNLQKKFLNALQEAESSAPLPCSQVPCMQIEYTSGVRLESFSTCTSFDKGYTQASWQGKAGSPTLPRLKSVLKNSSRLTDVGAVSNLRVPGLVVHGFWGFLSANYLIPTPQCTFLINCMTIRLYFNSLMLLKNLASTWASSLRLRSTLTVNAWNLGVGVGNCEWSPAL